MLNYSPSNKLKGYNTNKMFSNENLLLDITNDFISFKILFKKFFKTYNINIETEFCKIIFLEILSIMHKEELDKISDQIVTDLIDDLLNPETYISYEDLEELCNINVILENVLMFMRKHIILDYVVYKHNIKIIYKD